jgi:hypothetical protein
VIADLRHAHVLAGKRLAEIDLPTFETDASTVRDREGRIVEGIGQILQAAIEARRARVDVRRHVHFERLMRPLVVEVLDERIEARRASIDAATSEDKTTER